VRFQDDVDMGEQKKGGHPAVANGYQGGTTLKWGQLQGRRGRKKAKKGRLVEKKKKGKMSAESELGETNQFVGPEKKKPMEVQTEEGPAGKGGTGPRKRSGVTTGRRKLGKKGGKLLRGIIRFQVDLMNENQRSQHAVQNTRKPMGGKRSGRISKEKKPEKKLQNWQQRPLAWTT